MSDKPAETKHPQRKPVERKRGFTNAGQLADLITGPWRSAQIAVSDWTGEIRSIRRVSFHENESGTLIVVFHDGEARPKPREAYADHKAGANAK